jgi:Skp family chaperone for outer membrane proteins
MRIKRLIKLQLLHTGDGFMRIIKKKFSIALCLMLAIAMCSLSIVNTAALSMLSADVADNSDLKTKIGYIDFSYCYKSKTLGEDVKQDLKNVEKYIKQTKKYSLSDLNKLIKKADKASFDTYSISKGTDYSKYLPTSKVQLNSYEKKVFNSNPTYGMVVLVQADYANKQEKNRFGSNTMGTNGDAFRHALWNAMGARGTSVKYMEQFATAHEKGSRNYNPRSVDTQMDLKNNAIGRNLLKSMKFPNRPPNGMTIPFIITTNIANAVNSGKMVRYVDVKKQKKYNKLIKTNSSSKN